MNMAEVDTRDEVVEQPLSQGYREDAQQVTVEYHKPGSARPPSEKDVKAQEAIQESLDPENVADPGERVYVNQDVRSPSLAYATRDNIVVPTGTEAPYHAEVASDQLGQEVEVAINPGDRKGPVVAVPADGAFRPDIEEQVGLDDVDAGETLYEADPDSEDSDEGNDAETPQTNS